VFVGALAAAVSIGAASTGRTTASACMPSLDAMAVVAACDGGIGSDFRLSSGKGRIFQAGPAPNIARLRGVELAAGDRIVITGTAGPGAAVVALDVNKSGLATAVRFGNLGLEKGGRAILTVTTSRGRKLYRLLRPDGRSVSPTTTTILGGRRYITSVLVRRLGGAVDVSFTAVSGTSEVALLTKAAASDMFATGELEDPFLVFKTITTRAGTGAHVVLPMRSAAAWVYVKPLAPRLVMPGAAPLP
jgi:hypothetical protein